MRIWVMRHGEAGFNAAVDYQRSLTDKGVEMAFKQGQWLAKRLVSQGITLHKIMVSPYLRTQQTLNAMVQGLQAVDSLQSFANLSDSIENWEGITPSGKVDNVLNYLDFLQKEGIENVLMISHLPLVYDVVSALVGQTQIQFYPAVIAEIVWTSHQPTLATIAYP